MKTLIRLIVTLLMVSAVNAQELAILTELEGMVTTWRDNIKASLNALFFLLVFLDFAWFGITYGLRISGEEMGTFGAYLFKKVLFYGFGIAMLNFGFGWAGDIIDSHRCPKPLS